MSYLDIFLGGLLIYGFVRGFWNGFFIELASFVSLLLGIYVAIKFSYIMKSILVGHVSWNPKSIQIVAFILTFILVVIGISFLAKFLTKIANKARVKQGVDDYKRHCKKLTKSGATMSRQAHMELVVNNNYPATLGETIFYVNNGLKKTDGDVQKITKNNYT